MFAARRADIECLARDLEARGRARATITRRLCSVAGFYKYAVEEELLDHSAAAHVVVPEPVVDALLPLPHLTSREDGAGPGYLIRHAHDAVTVGVHLSCRRRAGNLAEISA